MARIGKLEHGAVTISVIIPVWNDATQLKKCLHSIEAQTLPRDRFEVIVVDNGSSDASRDVARSFSFVTLLEEHKSGSYAARNHGLAHARGNYVAFTDSDCEVAPDWLESGLRRASAIPNLGVLAGRIEVVFEQGHEHKAASIYERLFAFNQQLNVELGFAVTANWISPRELLVSVGGFDERLKSGGDSQLSRDLGKQGHQLLYANDVVVSHPARSSAADLFSKKRRVMGGNWGISKLAAPLRFLGLQYRQIMEALSRCKRIALEPSLRPKQRIQTISLVVSLWAVAATELTRLAFGYDARRR